MMRFLLPVAAWFSLGFLGILWQIPLLAAARDQVRSLPDAAEISDTGLNALVLAPPTLLLLAAVAIGVACADRAGLRSWLTSRLRGEARPPVSIRSLGEALLAALAAGVVAIAVDALFRLASPASFAAMQAPAGSWQARIGALLYGGITEELMLRLGLMTFLVWCGTGLLRNRSSARHGFVVVSAIVIVAIVFGLGHLPALSAAMDPDHVAVARTVLINAMLGIVYGWLYWQRGLEHAMLAHAATHVVFWTAGPLVDGLLRGAG